jgi:hypothetical protein
MSFSSSQSPLAEPLSNERAWEELVAREVECQARIEAAFDRADACERFGDVEKALEWLDEADALSGGLPPAYRANRERLKHQAE